MEISFGISFFMLTYETIEMTATLTSDFARLKRPSTEKAFAKEFSKVGCDFAELRSDRFHTLNIKPPFCKRFEATPAIIAERVTGRMS